MSIIEVTFLDISTVFLLKRNTPLHVRAPYLSLLHSEPDTRNKVMFYYLYSKEIFMLFKTLFKILKNLSTTEPENGSASHRSTAQFSVQSASADASRLHPPYP